MKSDPTTLKISVKESTKTCMLQENRSTVLDESKIEEIVRVCLGRVGMMGGEERGFGVKNSGEYEREKWGCYGWECFPGIWESWMERIKNKTIFVFWWFCSLKSLTFVVLFYLVFVDIVFEYIISWNLMIYGLGHCDRDSKVVIEIMVLVRTWRQWLSFTNLRAFRWWWWCWE